MKQYELLAQFFYDISKIIFATFAVGGILNYAKSGYVPIIFGVIATGLSAFTAYLASKQRKNIVRKGDSCPKH